MRRTISVDLSRFSAAGLGTVRGEAAEGLQQGEVVHVTDDDADVLEATVVESRGAEAELRVHWERVVRRS
jgi:hypothetical protein